MMEEYIAIPAKIFQYPYHRVTSGEVIPHRRGAAVSGDSCSGIFVTWHAGLTMYSKYLVRSLICNNFMKERNYAGKCQVHSVFIDEVSKTEH